LQFSIPIYSLTGTLGCKQYLAASDSRVSSKKMDFLLPDIQQACPACSRPFCAVWKGYYSRHFTCKILEYDGRIWVRKGLCKTKKIHFSMLPDFCIPYLRWSKFIFAELLSHRFKSFSNSLEWDLSFSTLYWIGALLVKLLRVNAPLFLLHPPQTNSVHELKNYSSGDLQNVPLRPDFNWNKKIVSSGLSPPP